MLKQPTLVPALIIGVITAGLSAIGPLAGIRLGEKTGKRAEILGGLI